MLDQLLNEMNVTRWVQRNGGLASENTESAVGALYFNSDLVAYLDVTVASNSEQVLLEKMLGAIGLSRQDCRDKVDHSLPLLHDGSCIASKHDISFSLAKLSTISSPDSKREAWGVLQKFRDKIK